jgi:hypothetical protein
VTMTKKQRRSKTRLTLGECMTSLSASEKTKLADRYLHQLLVEGISDPKEQGAAIAWILGLGNDQQLLRVGFLRNSDGTFRQLPEELWEP